ncbi:exosporium leader peptide-containing protein [Bacillus gaemokensis]|uniref:Exosporium leader peptide n=1 Tax=Bacillus gaemokensis TaxID=574375 RepID=A0A073K899_9BACI|nr:exosporium leader peptide-containing protein [Bacillus gaemokensis]KEK23504.1 hypothetical protein BAGA_08410 [Bacillus gaemokensis]KYG27127.1 hypothetical protein AZF08_15315 [Bacillus gaemokensis]
MSEKDELNSSEILYSAALNPSLIGPTLPSIPPFAFPSGSTGPTGPTGSTGSQGIVNVFLPVKGTP